jgi:putative FmdB family regulatory protein
MRRATKAQKCPAQHSLSFTVIRCVMPIYAYRCDACGHTLEKLQKISDSPLTNCPACGKAALVKQVTAAGFQLKGTGWYVTDFRGGSNTAAKSDSKSADGGADSGGQKASDATPAASATAASATATADSKPAAPATPTTSGGGATGGDKKAA